jgi:hypothetical protein
MIGLLKAEARKLIKRKIYWVMTLILALLVGFLAFIFFVLPNLVPDTGIPEIRKPEAFLFGAQQVAGQTWFPLIMAAMMLGGEVATTAWAASLTRNSRRWQHLLAKLGVLAVAAWVAMLAAIGGFAVVVALLAQGRGGPETSEWVELAWKVGVSQLTWVALGFAAAAWLRSIGPAIGAGIAFSFIDGIGALWKPWRTISLGAHASALLGSLDLDVGGGFGVAFVEDASFGKALAVVLAWTLAAAVAAVAGLQLRDP